MNVSEVPSSAPTNRTSTSTHNDTVVLGVMLGLTFTFLFTLILILAVLLCKLKRVWGRSVIEQTLHVWLWNRTRNWLSRKRNRLRGWFGGGGFERLCGRLVFCFCLPVGYLFCGVCALCGCFSPPDPEDMELDEVFVIRPAHCPWTPVSPQSAGDRLPVSTPQTAPVPVESVQGTFCVFDALPFKCLFPIFNHFRWFAIFQVLMLVLVRRAILQPNWMTEGGRRSVVAVAMFGTNW